MIQIDMQMPKNCLDCPACNEYLMCAIPVNGRKWGENDVHEFGQGRPEWCPMKEQEAVEPITQSSVYDPDTWFYVCGSCKKSVIDRGDKFCRWCGKAVEWDDK